MWRRSISDPLRLWHLSQRLESESVSVRPCRDVLAGLSLMSEPLRLRANDGCDLCKANEYGLQGICRPCPGNRVSVSGTDLGVFGCLCPSGKGVTTLKPDFCETCPPGQANGGGLQCFPCKAGEEPNAIKEACDACADGFYNGDEAGSCQACPPFHQSTRDRTGCTFGGCPSGRGVVEATGQPPTCVKCGDDQFVANTGACQTCPAGKVPTA